MAKKKKLKNNIKKTNPQKQYKNKPNAGTISLVIILAFMSLVFILVIIDLSRRGGSNQGTQGTQNTQQSTPDRSKEISSYQQRLTANPKDLDALIGIGNAYFDTQKYDDAIKYYLQAIEIDPNSPNVLTDTGTMYFYKTPSEPDKALDFYEKALKLQPNFENALLNKGVVLRDGKKDYKGAIEVWEKYLSLPNPSEKDKVNTWINEARSQVR